MTYMYKSSAMNIFLPDTFKSTFSRENTDEGRFLKNISKLRIFKDFLGLNLNTSLQISDKSISLITTQDKQCKIVFIYLTNKCHSLPTSLVGLMSVSV